MGRTDEELALKAIDRGIPSSLVSPIPVKPRHYRNLRKASGFIDLLKWKIRRGKRPTKESLLRQFTAIVGIPERRIAIEWLRHKGETEYYEFLRTRMNKRVMKIKKWDDWSGLVVDAVAGIPLGVNHSIQIHFYRGVRKDKPLWLSVRVWSNGKPTKNGLYVEGWAVLDLVPTLTRLMGRRKGTLTKLRNKYYEGMND